MADQGTFTVMEPCPPRDRRAICRVRAGSCAGARAGPGTRAAAWIITGPLGHAYGGAADWVVLVVRWRWARLRGRDRRTLE